VGLYQYKPLIFGISSAPEVCQHVIQQSLIGLEGVANISDGVIIHEKKTEDHNRSCSKFSETLTLTLNEEKCKFHMTQMVFIGLVLSDNGIGLAEGKVKAFVGTREPQSEAFWDYNVQFIPDFAAVAD